MEHSTFLSGLVLATLLSQVCQSCVELDPATVAGIIVTDVIATLLLALGVFCFAGHETGRLSGDRDDAQYSRLGGNWARSK
uniref:CD3 delta subunit of T-cell receptor complex n=1 Tax=Nomascus leucogenys TaxID=61853 RepID=A0A2I3G972_NOMLE